MIKITAPKTTLITVPQQAYFDRDTLEVSPNVGIVGIIKWAKKSGYDVDFYDIDLILPTDEQVLHYFKTTQPDIVGISAIVSTAYKQVRELTKIIKKANPNCLVVVGGHMTAAANTILRKTMVDICVLGDGEITFTDLIKYVDENGTKLKYDVLKDIKGLAYINGEKEMEFTGYGKRVPDLDLALPDYDILTKGVPEGHDFMKNYLIPVKRIEFFQHGSIPYDPEAISAKMWVTKGCFARCTFCQRFTLGIQGYDIDQVDQYLKELREKYNVTYMVILGENFVVKRSHSHAIAKLLKKHKMVWVVQGVRPNMITEEDLKVFADTGCVGIKYGIEAGSDIMLGIMEKKYKSDAIFNTVKNTNKYGIYTPLWFLIGMPGETNDTIMDMAEFLANMAITIGLPPNKLSVGSGYALPLPGSPLYEYGQLQGMIGYDVESEEEFLNIVSDMHTGKDGFINLTGQSMKTAIFWEYLFMYEAMKRYYEKIRRGEGKNTLKRSYATNDIGKKKKTHIFKRIKFYNFKKVIKLVSTKPISILNTFLYSSKFATYIPRFILYPVMRNLTYIEFLFQNMPDLFRYIMGNKEVYVYKYQLKRLRHKVDFSQGTSLRKVTEDLWKHYTDATDLTEKNQRVLLLGR